MVEKVAKNRDNVIYTVFFQFDSHILSATKITSISGESEMFPIASVVRLLDFHNRSSKKIVQEFSIDDRL